jgi:hypothetical protein
VQSAFAAKRVDQVLRKTYKAAKTELPPAVAAALLAPWTTWLLRAGLPRIKENNGPTLKF